MLVTKADDLSWSGWRDTPNPDRIDHRVFPRWRLWPTEDVGLQFSRAFEAIWREGGWTVYIDELYHVEAMGLKSDVNRLLTQGRAKKISIVVGMQRPAWVSRFALSETTHIFSFASGDKRDLKALSDGISEKFAEAVEQLELYQYAYYHKIRRLIKTGRLSTLDDVLEARLNDA